MSRLAGFAVVVVATILAIVGLRAESQVTASATITGVIKDGSGSGLPGVTVTISKNCKCRDCASKCDCCPAAKTGVTGADGSFTISGVEAGEYSVRAELEGFGVAARDSVMVNVGQSVSVELTLSSTDTESITVTP